MSDSLRGMPLLSGPPPVTDFSERSDMSCRKCNKEFNVLFTRAKRCYHCGYSYCSSCADYQALMPRSGLESGYDAMPVCSFCIEHLTFTAGGKGYLRSQSLAKLKKYIQAYNIPLSADVLEKDDVVDAIIAARGPNGCLPRANEEYYRKNSVPNGQNAKPRGFFARHTGQARPPSHTHSPAPQAQRVPSQDFPRPDLDPQLQTRPQSVPPTPSSNPRPAPPPTPPRAHQTPFHTHVPPYTPYTPRRPNPPSPYSRPTPAHSSHNLYDPPPAPPPPRPEPRREPVPPPPWPEPRREPMPPPPWPEPRREPTPRPRPRATSAATSPPARPQPQPVPTLDELLQMSAEGLAQLPVVTLKAVLFHNHVNARLVLEKSDLVARVRTLVDDEKRERGRNAAVQEQEEREILDRQRRMMEEQRIREEAARQAPREPADDISTENQSTSAPPSPPAAPILTPEAQAKAAALERNGLCVVCQDEDANIAIVDCGHLALCRNCSDLIMTSTRECPLCRTRIVTEARLLRIFKA